MEILKQTITLENSCGFVGKSKNMFSPLKEAIANSLDSILQRQKTAEVFAPLISVSVHFKVSKNLFGEDERVLDFISVEDNGVGFTKENLRRFKELAENTKGLNNRGTGKIQIFCRFKEISIESIFPENGKWNNLTASWKLNGEYDGSLVETELQSDTKTVVKMSGLYGDNNEQGFFARYLSGIGEFKRDILKHFLLRLWLGNAKNALSLSIETYLNGTEQSGFVFNKENIPEPDKTEKVLVDTEQAKIVVDKNAEDNLRIEWYPTEPKHELTICRFKLPSDDMDENGVYMCSKNIAVEALKLPIIRHKNANFNGYRYLTCIGGEILDAPEHVSQSVDKFNFPSKKDIEADMQEDNISLSLFGREDKFVFRDEIKNKVDDGLVRAYSDVVVIKEAREKLAIELAAKYGIPADIVEDVPISLSDEPDDVVKKLFEQQAKHFAKKNIAIQKTYEELKELEIPDLDPTSDDYRKKFKKISGKLLDKIPQQDKDELARYVIRRSMVVDLLKLALKNELAIQKKWAEKRAKGEKVRRDNEGIIHDLIFKRGTKGAPNDLWILNEEFVHFEGCSDMELDKLESNGEKLLQDGIDIEVALRSVGIEKDTYLKQRPDIFIFPEEGKCVLVEFKAPDVDLSQHTTQIARYARLIANYSHKPRHFKQFFGFLIGEKIDTVALTSEWKKVPFGNYRVYPSLAINSIDETEAPIANIYQEIIPLSEIAKRAEIRNRSFAEKLGINQAGLEKLQETDET
ncbi:ATPase [Betaproteobacteria bacterium]|nr:ATPase [Betaproteobacteria bacterium]